jgi:hypothetical protein
MTMTSSNDLKAFCRRVVELHGDPRWISEEDRAGEFRKAFGLEPPITVEQIRDVAISCGIEVGSMSGRKMPGKVRGFHQVYDRSKAIYYKDGDVVSGIANTLLHEMREMMEPLFAEASPGYQPMDSDRVHIAANKFASAVLLPKTEFADRMYRTGLDVFALAAHYRKSAAQVLLRMGEVMDGYHFFYGGLYERDWRLDLWSLKYRTSVPSPFPLPNVDELGSFFPRKGAPVEPGSFVDMAIRGRKPYMQQIFTMLDVFLEQKGEPPDGLIVLARPLVVSGEPAKVGLTALFWQDRALLRPQLKRIDPEVVRIIDPRDFKSYVFSHI